MNNRARRRKAPVRTCVGCRRRASKSELLRVVADEGTVAPDPHGHRPGRGAYLHRDAGCLDLAERRRALPRALRQPGGLDHTALRAMILAGAPAQALDEQVQAPQETALAPRETAKSARETGSAPDERHEEK